MRQILEWIDSIKPSGESEPDYSITELNHCKEGRDDFRRFRHTRSWTGIYFGQIRLKQEC